ncbi:MAG: hypothetical protein J5J06_07550 [Phycisphaerae bacterium]|nr:hypothetical protein [Phycisphaerae bacterium]
MITANGIHGGPTPNGKMIAMSLFNERQPIPQEEVYGVDKNGKLTERPLQRTQEGDIIREVETTVLMEPQVAARIRDWLDAMIRAVPNQTGQKP